MKEYGLPDESCMPYSATDYTKYGKKRKTCPAIGYCTNCMPIKVGRGRAGAQVVAAWQRESGKLLV